MASYDDVAAFAESLPEVTVGARWGNRTWFVGKTGFAWERPFSKADIKRLGDAPRPSDPILAVRVDDMAEKEAVLSAHPGSFFTIPHFDGYPAVLIELGRASLDEVHEALVDGWLACAPAALAKQHAARLLGDG